MSDDKPPGLQPLGAPRPVDRDRLAQKHAGSTSMPAAALPYLEEDERTNPHATPLETLESRSRRTLAQTISGRSEVSQLRTEVTANHKEVNHRIDVMGEHVGNLREGLGEVNGTLIGLTTLIQGQHAQSMQHQTITMTAKVDVEKAEKMATIDEVKEANKFKRDLALKIIAIVGTIAAGLGTLITLLVSKC